MDYMNAPIPTIQHELDRRFSLTYTETKDKEGRIDLTVNYLRVYDYIHYIESTPVLSQLMDEEFDRRRKYVTWIIMQQNFPDTTPNTPPEDTHRELNQAFNYAHLYEDVYERIDQLNDTDPPNMDLWGVAFTRTPLQILRFPVPLKDKLKIIKYKIKRSSYDFQNETKQMLNGVHYRLMNLIAEYEARPDSQKQPKPMNEAILQLNLTPQSKWQDIELTFRNEFEVKIKYQEREIIATHEHMGFADKRKPDQTQAKSSWELLRLLAMNNGAFPLTKLDKEEKAKRKKQKQELTKLLKIYFGLDDDPFHELTKEESEYKIKIKLIPDPDSREQWADRNIFETTKNYPKEFLGKY